ncbi:MAG TPA: winged helix-turn-helix domain-containing protein [Verrucomicrobiae bacterium]|nr:winged helix-turn-helix domain-containing protein [Verrucomicrobiae bacterium]
MRLHGAGERGYHDAAMRLLIVEDETRVAAFLKKGFEAEAIAVDVTGDGRDGAVLARDNDYDVIVLDLTLPGLDGLGVLESIRKAGKKTPVLILSARGALEDRVKGLDLGADDYLPKPFAFAELLARVRALMRRQAGDVLPSLRVDDLSLDLATRRAKRGDREIELTNKEFQLLEYLMRHKNRVLSRVLIVEHIWDMQFDGGTNVVDVVINRLRRKIDDGAKHALIRTARGVGYVLEEPGR